MSGQFTDAPDRPSTIVFPHQTAQAVSFAIFLIAFATISGMITRRTLQLNFFSWKSWMKLSYTKILSIWVFIDSWLFLVFAGMLLYGVGTSTNSTSCMAGVIACITFYFISKILISFFLLERVHIVHNQDGTPRMRSVPYKVCLAAISLYIGYLILAAFGRVGELDENRSCHIGLKLWVTIPMIVYDIALNLLLTVCFLYPIRRETTYNFRLRKMAFRTVMASFAAFGSSTINIALVAGWQGHQQGWFCLLACSLDVLVNAAALYWITAPGAWSHNAEGFDTSEYLVTTRKSQNPEQERSENTGVASRPRETRSIAASLTPIHDKDEYLKPQPNVYYPLGTSFGSHDNNNALHYLAYNSDNPHLHIDALHLQPPMIPEPSLLLAPRIESEMPFRRQSSSFGSAVPMPVASPNPAGTANGDRQLAFKDFLDEEAIRLPRGPVECRRNSQEEVEGRFQKAFFNVLLGTSKTPTSGPA